MDRLSIIVPCDLRFRDSVGALIHHVCQRLEQEGVEPGLSYQVVSAFNEAFNNLAQYAYEPTRPGVVEVHLELTPTQIALELRDTGRTFDFQAVESPDLTELPESGLGIFIIRSFMTDVIYRPGAGDGQPNQLRMIRTLGGRLGQVVQGTNSDA